MQQSQLERKQRGRGGGVGGYVLKKNVMKLFVY